MSAGSGAAAAAGTATSALCLLLSLTAVAVCLLLGAKTAELQGRLAALEERGAAGTGPLLDALQPRVERIFREVSGPGRRGEPRVRRGVAPGSLPRPPVSRPLWKNFPFGKTSSLLPNFLPPRFLAVAVNESVGRGGAKPVWFSRAGAPGGKASTAIFENVRLFPSLHSLAKVTRALKCCLSLDVMDYNFLVRNL